MAARVSIDGLAILDELESRMRRTAGRVAALANGGVGDAASRSRLREAAEALSRFVPELTPVAEELAGAGTGPSDGTGPGTDGGPAAQEDLSGIDSTTLALGARGLLASGGEDALPRARKAWDFLSDERLGPTGAPGGEDGATDPAGAAAWMALSADLWSGDGHVRYLDAVEKAYYNAVLFAQADDGAGVEGRTLDGEPGEADDPAATPALALALATAGGHVLTTDADGALVSGISANASATLSVGEAQGGEKLRLRVFVQTQMPVRGWTSWVFDPLKETSDSAPVSTVTRRTARNQRAAMRSVSSAPAEKEAGPATFAFRVRVPEWASSSKMERDDGEGGSVPAGSTASSGRRGPGVKIDGRPANVKRSDGFYRFEVPTDRKTKIEVTLDIGPWMLDRRSTVSWGNEVAVGYGPLLLTALARLNPGEDLGMPLRIMSQANELELVGDIRRRMPLVRARALGVGGRAGRILLAPVSEVGGFACGTGGRRVVRCQKFRTWHRRGR